MKITVTLDEARELAGAVTGPLRDKLLETIIDNTETYEEGTCAWCHQTVTYSGSRWVSDFGRDVCKRRPLGPDGEYQWHQVHGSVTRERERPRYPGSLMIALEGREQDGARRIWQQQLPLQRGQTWQEWFTPDYEIMVSGVTVSVAAEP